MPRVFVPTPLRPLCQQHEFVDVAGTNVRAVIDQMDHRFTGFKAALCDGDRLRTGLAVVVDGSARPLGLLQPVGESSEVHFLPAVGGG